jgi:hypothetical protein
VQVVKLQGGVMRAGFLQVEIQQGGVLWCGELKGGARECAGLQGMWLDAKCLCEPRTL